MAKDDRLYAKFTLDFPDSPKIKPLPLEAKWALVEMVCYSRRMKTDGFLSKPLAIASWGAEVCLALTTNDPAKPSLREVENGYLIHDFAEHQTTTAEIDALAEKRRAAGQKGGKARAKQVLGQSRGKSNPETETQTDTTTAKAVVEAKQKRAHRIPENWRPSEATKTWALANHAHLDLKEQYEAFMDYWLAASGANARKLDWDRAFKGWLRNARPKPQAVNGNRPAASDAAFAQAQALKLVPNDRLELE